MLAQRRLVELLVCVLVCFNIVSAGILFPFRRDDSATTTAIASTATDDADQTQTQTVSAARMTKTESVTDASATANTTSAASTTTASATVMPSAINGNTDTNVTAIASNATIAAGELPLQPQLTPGWGVAGIIMLLTGGVYAFIGIKNKLLHSFLSTAYLTSLGVAVLIVYVMVPPVSNGVQGAYVVAAVMTGMILGAGAAVFREITEALGCLLGSFCLSMWLLVLKDGGLLTSTSGKVIFIIVFTAAGFALYFSRYTRVYALIGSISFSGATVAILGIDCFTRAGLKEFWAYLWGLNTQLFPASVDTYPVTKAIRVEIALIIIIAALGIISQLRLWKVVQAHRAKRAEEQAEARRHIDLEEAQLGEQIEQQTAREKRQWEATYGEQRPGSPSGSGDSGFADLNEKGKRSSQTTAKHTLTEEEIEMADVLMSSSPKAPSNPPAEKLASAVVLGKDNEGRVTVRVAKDEQAPGQEVVSSEPDQKIWVVGTDGEPRPLSRTASHKSHRLSKAMGPEVIPLPFRIPELDECRTARSSVATFADEDACSIRLKNRASKQSLVNRLSTSSNHLLRSLSRGSVGSKRKVSEVALPPQSPNCSESREDLVQEAQVAETGSVAAIIDRMSCDSSRISPDEAEPGTSKETTAELSATSSHRDRSQAVVPPQGQAQASSKQDDAKLRPHSTASTSATISTDILNASALDDSTDVAAIQDTSGDISTQTETNTGTSQHEGTVIAEEKAPMPTQATSVVLSTDSAPVSLSKDRLPGGFSRVASTYRTNEWAKHLSQAETPEPEQLQLDPYPVQGESAEIIERVAPVDIQDLQQTAETGTPAPAPARSSPSRVSGVNQYQVAISRSNSKISLANRRDPAMMGHAVEPNIQSISPYPVAMQQPAVASTQNMRMNSIAARHSVSDIAISHPESSGMRSTSASPAYDQQYFPANPDVVSYSSPQTLLGKREMLLRKKSSMVGPSPSYPAILPAQPTSSDSGSMYNYPVYPSYAPQDLDDLPLSQRKQLMRQSSLSSSGLRTEPRSDSHLAMSYIPAQSASITAENAGFDSHQPARRYTGQSHATREAQLASFRQSLANDLRAAPPVLPAGLAGGGVGYDVRRSTSSTSLIQAHGGNGSSGNLVGSNSGAEVRRSIEQGWNLMLSQRDQEARRREVERFGRERSDRMFEEGIRSGYLMEAHRDALRKMQNGARAN
ncbi:hypothetical protein BX600DRAFT_214955 [Xylariales sp. PMI_506]|nr:hypothetical protein BX600DRAFT_214955 [Xylariales sp. PMI_506]